MSVKILIIDDEPINVKLIEDILEYEDAFESRSVYTGEEALEALKTFTPDIILLDIMMPGMDGYEVCRRIKSDPQHTFAKILMVSGKSLVEERLEGYEAGADDYITKPFIDDELLAKLKVFSNLKKSEEVDELKTSILQLFSHETKTPLNGILLGSQLILDTPTLPAKILEYAQLIKYSGERIHELVRKILLLSSLKNNRDLNPGSQSIQQYLNGFIDQISRDNPKNCPLVLNYPTDFTMDVDWKLFHEAFRSVVDNAIKHSPEGQQVTINVTRDEQGATFKISDTGPGLTPTMQEKIFDEFHAQEIQLHSQGTALSLAIAKEIMRLHDGSITVTSQPAKLTTFTISIPAHCINS